MVQKALDLASLKVNNRIVPFMKASKGELLTDHQLMLKAADPRLDRICEYIQKVDSPDKQMEIALELHNEHIRPNGLRIAAEGSGLLMGVMTLTSYINGSFEASIVPTIVFGAFSAISTIGMYFSKKSRNARVELIKRIARKMLNSTEMDEDVQLVLEGILAEEKADAATA